ncbi:MULTISPECIES: hypothetical protein [spotted fever group]|uniref:Uncharacterized protein n=2 Tax=spotted fever group TaxID=114277 RepID=A0A0F3PHK7_RICRH|nr:MULTISPECIES: hypothetical protein [spotted fever group]AFB31694.1 hypothetical protein RMB_04565 [Rickettsia massiliae str. AZT80]KJV79411.1 hypothetical protein RMAECT_1355 [Rickettsia rhipicephali str. Ect]
MNAVQGEWRKIPVPEYLILSNLKSIITDFNSTLPTEYHLITDESVFECKEAINEFTVLGNNKDKHKSIIQKPQETEAIIKPTNNAQSQSITSKPIEEYREYVKNDDYGLTGATHCTIS